MSATLHFINIDKLVCLPGQEDINMSNANARLVLTALGFPPNFEDCDPLTPQELLEACDLYLTSEIASVVDTGRETTRSRGTSGCTLTFCGQEAGYITRRVESIKEQCELAQLAGADKCYFA